MADETAENIETADGAEGTSKNALKKAAKAEEAAKKKAAKDEEKKAKKASEPEKQAKVGVEDAEELDPTQYYENRIKAITNMEVTSRLRLQRANAVIFIRHSKSISSSFELRNQARLSTHTNFTTQ